MQSPPLATSLNSKSIQYILASFPFSQGWNFGHRAKYRNLAQNGQSHQIESASFDFIQPV